MKVNKINWILIIIFAVQTQSVVPKEKKMTIVIGKTRCGQGAPGTDNDAPSLIGYEFDAKSIGPTSSTGQNNSMTIGPCGTSRKFFHTWGWDDFYTDGIVKELAWREVDPVTGKKMRFCHVTLEKSLEYSSVIYVYDNCRLYAWENRPEGRTLHQVVYSYKKSDVVYENEMGPSYMEAFKKFRESTGHTHFTPHTNFTPCDLLEDGSNPCSIIIQDQPEPEQ